MTDFQITPAEAALLLKPRRGSATSCVQCALLALLAKGHVALQDGEGLFGKKRLLRRPGDGSLLPGHHRAVKDALFAGNRDDVTANEAAAELRRAFGSDHGRYVHQHVAPALIHRGLLTREDRKWLGLVPYTHYEHSAEGRRRADQIGALLDELAGMKKLVRDDPYRARRLLEAAGILVILSPQARAQAKKLKEMLREGSGDGATVTYASDGSADWEIGVEVGELGTAADCMDLLDGVSCAGAFTGGDGGGDGGDGGGDGGGGGD